MSEKEVEGNGEEQHSLPLSVIKTDVNLARLPFFLLFNQGLEGDQIEFTIIDACDNGQAEFSWSIIPSTKYGHPGILAKKVHKAVEYLMTKRGFPLSKHLDFSLYEIAGILDMEPSGKVCNSIKHAILSTASTTIESKGTFYYLENGRKRRVHDTFHLYERVVFAGEELPDGTTLNRNRIYFSDWYLKSLNSLYIKPLDFKYWKSLRSSVAGRLYEYLSYISYATKCRPFSIKYQRLCDLLPITPQRYLSKAKYCLKNPHRELIQTGFLKKVIWRESKTEEKEWVLVYYFGKRAEKELRQGFDHGAPYPEILAVETAEMLPEAEEELQEEKKREEKKKRASSEKEIPTLASELHERGITKAVATQLVELFPEDYIKEKIELLDKLTMIDSSYVRHNPAGWLRRAIEEDYQLTQQQRRRINKKAVSKESKMKQKALEVKAEEIRKKRISEDLTDFPPKDEWIQKRIDRAVDGRNELVKHMPSKHPYTQEEISKMRQEYGEKYPETEEERREWLQRQPSYRIDRITEELKSREEKEDN